jgi:predicted permease
VRGRDFGTQDHADGLPVAIVNESFERRFFPEGDATGKRIRIGGRQSGGPWLTIIGVVRDLYADGLQNEDPEAIYRPFAQNPARFFTIVARTPGDPMALTAGIRQTVTGLDRDLPLYFVERLDNAVARANWFYNVFGNLFAIFGAVALFLAGVGLYGVMSFSVSQRTREMGVRMALGAGRHDVLRLVLGQGMIQTGVGLAAGTLFALYGTRFLSLILFQVKPRDPAIFAAILIVLLGSAALACWLPARRATRVDPLEALRFE